MIFRIFLLLISVAADCKSRNNLENRMEVICKNLDNTYETGLKVKKFIITIIITNIKSCLRIRSYKIIIMAIFFNFV